MMLKLQHEVRHSVSNVQLKTITPHKTVDLLLGMVQQREWALSLYPNYLPNTKKLAIAGRLKDNLMLAKISLNSKQAIIICLRCERDLRSLVPSATNKLHKTYMNKLDGIMNACREFLCYSKQ